MKNLRYSLFILCCALLLASCAPRTQANVDSASPEEQLQGVVEGISFDTTGDIGDAAPIVSDFENPVVIRWVYDGRPATLNRTLLGLDRGDVNELMSFLVPVSPVPSVGFVAKRDLSGTYDLIGLDAPEGWEVDLRASLLSREVSDIVDNLLYFRDTIDFFFETNIPTDTEPGFYTINARVEHTNGVSTILPVRVEVLASEEEVATAP